MANMSRIKGKRAELEVAMLLEEHLGEVVRRNLAQCRDGGDDLRCAMLAGYAIEVKRAEEQRIDEWWDQACAQAQGRIPVLVYRANRKPWCFVLPLGALHPGFAVTDYSLMVGMGIKEFAAIVRETP
jgi:Holliday junction resolvase